MSEPDKIIQTGLSVYLHIFLHIIVLKSFLKRLLQGTPAMSMDLYNLSILIAVTYFHH